MKTPRKTKNTPPPVPPIVKGRVPPHDLDAEAAVLSAILLVARALDLVIEFLKPEHFYSDSNGRIYEACLALAAASTPIDIVAVAGFLRDRRTLKRSGGSSYLAQLADATPAVANIEAHARIVFEKWRVRAVIATCQRVAAEGYGDVGEVQEYIDGAEQGIYELARSDERRPMKAIGTAIREEFKRIVDATERGELLVGMPTGYTRLDETLAGLAPGDVTVIGARPGMGKTAAGLALGVNLASPRRAWAPALEGEGLIEVEEASGYGVCVFSLEMPEAQLTSRMVCAEARVDTNKYRRRMLQPDDWSRLATAALRLTPLPLWIDDTPARSLLELRAAVRRRQADFNRPAAPGVPAREVGAVIVDYIQLMAPSPGIQLREQQIADLARGLKTLAKELGVHVIALAQLNRELEKRQDKRPQLADLRESGELEQSADNVILLYRDEYYAREKSKMKGIAEWICAKVRNGPPGTVFLRCAPSYMRFDNLAPGQEPVVDDDG